MAELKFTAANEAIAESITVAYDKVERALVGAYNKLESSVMSGYTKLEDVLIERYLTNDGRACRKKSRGLKRKHRNEQCRCS